MEDLPKCRFSLLFQLVVIVSCCRTKKDSTRPSKIGPTGAKRLAQLYLKKHDVRNTQSTLRVLTWFFWVGTLGGNALREIGEHFPNRGK